MAKAEADRIAGWVERARERMSVRGLTYDDLAKPLGIGTRGGVSHYFNGRRQLSAEQAVALAELLECPLEWLLAGKQVAQPSAKVPTSAKLPSLDEIAQMIQDLPPELYGAVARLISELAATKASTSSRKRVTTRR